MYNIAIVDTPLIFRNYTDHTMSKNACLRKVFEPRSIAVVASEIDPGFWYECRQPCDEIHRFEGHLGRAIPVRCLQGVNHLARGAQ